MRTPIVWFISARRSASGGAARSRWWARVPDRRCWRSVRGRGSAYRSAPAAAVGAGVGLGTGVGAGVGGGWVTRGSGKPGSVATLMTRRALPVPLDLRPAGRQRGRAVASVGMATRWVTWPRTRSPIRCPSAIETKQHRRAQQQEGRELRAPDTHLADLLGVRVDNPVAADGHRAQAALLDRRRR